MPVVTRQIGDLELRITELTVEDVRAWLRDLESGQHLAIPDELVDLQMLLPDVDIVQLIRLANLTPELILPLAARQVREIDAAVREVNADFFALRVRLEKAGREVQALTETSEVDLTSMSPA